MRSSGWTSVCQDERQKENREAAAGIREGGDKGLDLGVAWGVERNLKRLLTREFYFEISESQGVWENQQEGSPYTFTRFPPGVTSHITYCAISKPGGWG